MKRLLLIGILLWGVQAFASSCSSTGGGGNWDQTGSWTSCGGVVPQVGDTVTITAGNPITVPAGYSTNNVNSVTFSGTNASLTVAATGTLNAKALTFAGTTPSLTNNGTVTINPGASSTAVTISSGAVFTNNGTINAGYPSAVAGTSGILLNQGGTITSNVGSIVNLYGDVNYQNGTTANWYGTAITFKPPSGVKFVYNATITGSGVGSINFCATSACDGTNADPNGGTYTPTTITTDLSSGGTAFQFTSASTANRNNFYTNGLEVRNCGGASAACISLPSTSPVGWYHINRALFVSTGQIWAGVTAGIDSIWDKVTMITPVQSPYFQMSASTDKTSESRLITNLVVYFQVAAANSAMTQCVSIQARDFQIGKSLLRDGTYAAGIIGYGCQINVATGSTTKRNVTRSSMITMDFSGSGGALSTYIATPNSQSYLQDSVMLQTGANNHFWTESGTDQALGDNYFQANILDADGEAVNDAGDNCFQGGGYNCYGNIFLNNSGTAITQSGSSAASIVRFKNNTSIFSQAATLGEANMTPNNAGPFSANIFHFPSGCYNACGSNGYSSALKTMGIYGTAKFMMQNTQFTLAANYYWGMGGSGDTSPYFPSIPGATAGNAPMIQSAPGVYSYLAVPIAGVWGSGTMSAGTDPTTGPPYTVACASGCSFFANQVNEFYIKDTTKGSFLPITSYTSSTQVGVSNNNFALSDSAQVYPNGYVGASSCTVSGSSNPYTLTCTGTDFVRQGVVAGCFVVNAVTNLNGNLGTVVAVTDATHLTFNQSSRAVTTGTVTIEPNYRADGTLYGAANFGATDLHIDPSFVDPTATVCRWAARNTGRNLTYCSQTTPLSVTSYSSGTYTVNGGGANSVPSQWQVGDKIMVMVPSSAAGRGYDTIATIAGDRSSFTGAGVSGTVNTDVIQNLWTPETVSKAMATLNGFDYTGAPCSSGAGCSTWATVSNLLDDIRKRVRPMNGAFKNAAPSADCDRTKVDNTCDVGAVDSFPAAILQQ